MRILVANDDGYLAPGLQALVEACRGLGSVDVVAPEQNASGTSNSLTLHRPLSAFKAPNGYTFINGTPSDCVHVALTGLLEHRPDLVVSGINNGANMGEDTLYSGTVAAAMEAYLFGIPAIAFSLVDKGWTHLDAAAAVARRLIEQVVARPPAQGAYLLNVNIPNLPLEQLRERGARRHVARLAVEVDGHGARMVGGDEGVARGVVAGVHAATCSGDPASRPGTWDSASSTMAGAISQPWRNRPFRRVSPVRVSIMGRLSGSAGRRLDSECTMRASASSGITLCAALSRPSVVRTETGERSSDSISLAPTTIRSPGRATM